MGHDELTDTRSTNYNDSITTTTASFVIRRLKSAIKKLETLKHIEVLKHQTSHYSYGLPTETAAIIVKDRIELRLSLNDDYIVYCQVIFDPQDYLFPPDIVFKKGTLPPLRTGKQYDSDVITHLLPTGGEWDLNDENCLYHWFEQIISYFEKNVISRKLKKTSDNQADEWAFLSALPDEPSTSNTTPKTDDIWDTMQRKKNKLFKQKMLNMLPSTDNNDSDFQDSTMHLPKAKAATRLKRLKQPEESYSTSTERAITSTANKKRASEEDIIDMTNDNDDNQMISDDDWTEQKKRPYASIDRAENDILYPRQQQQQRMDSNDFDIADLRPSPTKRLRKAIKLEIEKRTDDERAVSRQSKEVEAINWNTNLKWRKFFVMQWLEYHKENIMFYDASTYKSLTLYKAFDIPTESSTWRSYAKLKQASVEKFKSENNIVSRTGVAPAKPSAPMLVQINMDKDAPNSKLHIRLISALNSTTRGSAVPVNEDLEYEVDPSKPPSSMHCQILSFLTEKACQLHLYSS